MVSCAQSCVKSDIGFLLPFSVIWFMMRSIWALASWASRTSGVMMRFLMTISPSEKNFGRMNVWVWARRATSRVLR